MNQPLVSIIIPTYNSERTLDQCLNSLVDQDYENIEIIVVDNYSTDSTEDIAQETSDRLLKKDGGMGVQVNYGVSKANGEYICYFDDDMYLHNSVISSCVKSVLSGDDAVVIPEETLHNSYWASIRDYEKELYQGKTHIEAARFFDKSVYQAVGGIDEDLSGYRDFDVHQKVKRRKNTQIGYCAYPLEHDVESELLPTLKKRFNRASTFTEYATEHPNHATSVIFRKELFLGILRYLYKKPTVGVGLLVLKIGEYAATALGILASFLTNEK